MNPISLDSNVILRLVLNDVPAQSLRAADLVGESACYVTDVVVAECVFVLEKVYKLDRERIKDLMGILFRLNAVALSENLMKTTFELYMKWHPLSFVDCYSIAEATLNENGLATFDRAILKKGASTTLEPK